MTESIDVGFQVFVGSNSIGAVRAVDRTKKEFVVYVENSGEFTVGAAAIQAVHDEKVMLSVSSLAPALRRAIGHSHDAEDR